MLSKCTNGGTKNSYMIVVIISSGGGAQSLCLLRLDVAINAAIVYNEGETDRGPLFSIPGLSTFTKLGVVEIGRIESHKLKSKLL